MACNCNDPVCSSCGSISVPEGPQGTAGLNGWTPQLAVVNDGERRVLQLTGWTGGQGATPGGVGQYVGAAGLVVAIASGVDIRGATGATGSPRYIPFHIANSADVTYKEVAGAGSYTDVGFFVFPGTGSYNYTPAIILANVYRSAGGDPFDVRIRDVTNTTVIAGITGQTGATTGNIVSLGSIGNLPAAAAVWSMQVQAPVGTEVRITSATIGF